MFEHAPYFPPLHELARLVAGGQLTSAELVTECLRRIEERESRIRAWAHVDAAYALSQARLLDSVPVQGPLHGIPAGIKDVIDTRGVPTSLGSLHLRHRVPEEDAACVSMLRQAGAVILGKTVTSEFASLAPSETRNPRNLGHTPGGSSSGSAAAVAAGMVPFALGTQTLGSTIRPASYCGVIGMKPTFGYLPVGGVLSSSQRMDTLGMFASHADDLSTVLSVLAGAGPADASLGGAAPARELAVARTPWWDAADDSSRAACEFVVDVLASNGRPAVELSFPAGAEELPELQRRIAHFEMAHSLRAGYLRDRFSFSDLLRSKIEEGLSIPHSVYWSSLDRVDRLRPDMQRLFAGGRIVVTPATTGVAPAGVSSTGDSIFNRPWSILGNPVVSVPVLRDTSTGLPVSVQLIGRVGDDFSLIHSAELVGRLTESPALLKTLRQG